MTMRMKPVALSMLLLFVLAACTQGDDDDGGENNNNNGGPDYVCTVSYCEDLVTYCEFAIQNDCGNWGDYTMQGCIDGLISNFSYCGYPANIASCLADCSDESAGCYDLDYCSEDHECSWFGDCP